MSKKTIQLNPDFMKTTRNRHAKNRSKKEKIKSSKMPANTNIMRKQLLKKIKDYQKSTEDKQILKDKQNKLDQETTNNVFTNEFNKSLDFLQNLSSKKKALTRKNKKSANKTPNLTASNFTSSEGSPIEIKIATELPIDMLEYSNMSVPKTNSTLKNYCKDPPYGCLKNGSKPIYRDWKRKTQKNNILENISNNVKIDSGDISENIMLNVTDSSTDEDAVRGREVALRQMKDKFNTLKQAEPTQEIEHRVKTKTFQLGKHKKSKRISILIKNRNTRKRIKEEHGCLKQKSILEVKNYLRKKNLLKTGSDAPPDVLRTMYENSILVGDINNKTNETLVHNFHNA